MKARQPRRSVRGFFNGLPTLRNGHQKPRGLRYVPRYAHHHRQSHRQNLRDPHHTRHHPRRRPPADQSRSQRIRHDELRSGLQQHGILHQRGYPIEDLAEKSTYLETAYLLLNGELPTATQLKDWTYNVTHHTYIHESIKKFLDGFHYDAHPMGMTISTIAALSTFYHDAKDIFSAESRNKQTYRLIGKMPTIAAFAYRHTLGMPYVYPDNDLSYPGNFLNMLFRTSETKYRPNPTLERALDILFILHADHEQNCSANTIRGVGSSHVDPYSATAAAIAALYGPLHG